jgi:hypothetical protein
MSTKKKDSPILPPPPPPSHSRRKTSKSPDKSPKYKVGDEFFSKNYKYNLRIKKITSDSYVFEKADDEIHIGKGDTIGSLSFNDVDDYPKEYRSLKDSKSHKGGRKTIRNKNVKQKTRSTRHRPRY